MSPLLMILLVTGACALALVGLWRLAARARRRGIAGPVRSVFDEVRQPIAPESRHDVRGQEERPAPQPSPGNEPGGDGGIRL